MGFLNLAFGYINSALAAVLFFTNPFWVLILAHFCHIDRLTLKRCLGLILGITGVALCLNIDSKGNILGIVFALCGALSWALCTIGSKSILATQNPPFCHCRLADALWRHHSLSNLHILYRILSIFNTLRARLV